MRLAHFIQRYPPALGGAEAYFARLSRWCAERGDQVTVFTSNALSLEAFWSRRGTCVPSGVATESGVTLRRYPLWTMPGRRWLLKPLSLVPNRLWQCLTMPCNPISFAMWRDAGAAPCEFDAVHASAFPYAFPIACARRLARHLRVPFFITPFLHLGDPDDPHDRTRGGYTSPALTWLLNEADGVFVQTPSERDAALAFGLSREKVILQGLGVDPQECTGGNRVEARRRWNLPDDAFVVGHLANNSWEKGTNDLLQAIERVQRPIHVLLAGPQMPNFTQFWDAFTRRHPSLSASEGPPHPAVPFAGAQAPRFHVRRLGPISDADKRDFFAVIDVFALPSRSDSFGLVLLEAWANGIPNIAYRAGGPADIVRHDVDGLLVKCGDIDALAHALQRLHDDVDLRVRLGIDGKARLPSDFLWEDKLALVRQSIMLRVDNKRAETAVRPVPNVVNFS
ncbi:MAG: glycosyltransferase family 4 protein [Planctomycetes bacterium]|nr:glycosyltransferase family 4 protein [Planctomycetota bacterium]